MKCPVIELLTEIRDRLRNLDTLEEKRAVKAAQQARYRERQRQANTGGRRSSAAAGTVTDTAVRFRESAAALERRPPRDAHDSLVDTTQCVDTTKEDEKGKAEERLSLSRVRARFVPPTPEEVAAYCRERENAVDPIVWWNFYAAKGWMIGKSKMVDWKRAVITWERDRTGDGSGACGRDGARPSLDPKAAAFERQRAEAAERRRHAAELLTESGALPEGGAR